MRYGGPPVRWLPAIATILLGLWLGACGGAASPLSTPSSGATTGAPPTAPASVAAGSAAGTTAAGGARLPRFSHVFLIVMENEEAGAILGNAAAPYINHLATTYAVATNAYAVAHPSLPNYLALVAGSTLGVQSDCTSCVQTAPNLADQLEAHGRTWRAYMEGLPRPCYRGSGAGRYALKHDPWLYFSSIRSSRQRCANVVPLTRLSADLRANTIPDLAWITPNLCHDMHDCSIATGDAWLASFLPSILASPAWKNNGVVFIVWDEGSSDAGCCGAGGGGHVPLLILSPVLPAGARLATPVNHYSVLRTIEDAWSLGELGGCGLTPNSDACRALHRGQ